MREQAKRKSGGASSASRPSATDEKGLIRKDTQGDAKKQNLINYLKLCINSVEQFPTTQILQRTAYERLVESIPENVRLNVED